MGTTTLKDYGRHSAKHGDIPFYYGFPFRFWFGEHQLAPEDVETWCKENCVGYYKTVSYTHKSSVRLRDGRFDSKVVFIDKIYLQNEADAMRVKLQFDVKDEVVKRPERIKARRKKRAKKA
jgi:hypothetical protein